MLGLPSEVLGLVADSVHCQPLNLEPQMGSLIIADAVTIGYFTSPLLLDDKF